MSYEQVKSLLKKGISRPTLYEVSLPVISGEANRQLQFLCSAASVPEVSANVIAANGHESQGVVREQAVNIMFGKPFSITVISDRDYTVYKSIREQWMSQLSTNFNPNSIEALTGSAQKMGYYDSYKRDITLTKLEQNGIKTFGVNNYYSPFRITFNNAYPVRVGELTLSSEATDSRMEFNVDFTYETYSVNNFDITNGIFTV
jgi:hypothetical protein